jgi:CO/xanthine dehydrogenase Mo-binding subunit
MSRGLSRRGFLFGASAVAGGLVLGARSGVAQAPGAAEPGHEVTAWIVIQSDDTTIIRVARSDMGQGIFTALPMLVAEGLECDWAKVRAEYADTNRNVTTGKPFGNMVTSTSISVRDSHVRLAGSSIAASLSPCWLRNGVDHALMDGFSKEDLPYEVSAYQVACARRDTAIPVGFWRGVNLSQNGFFREAFVDEMAEAAGLGPLEFRRQLLTGNPRALRVLNECAAQAGWGHPNGLGRADGRRNLPLADRSGQGRHDAAKAGRARRDRPSHRLGLGAGRRSGRQAEIDPADPACGIQGVDRAMGRKRGGMPVIHFSGFVHLAAAMIWLQ